MFLQRLGLSKTNKNTNNIDKHNKNSSFKSSYLVQLLACYDLKQKKNCT